MSDPERPDAPTDALTPIHECSSLEKGKSIKERSQSRDDITQSNSKEQEEEYISVAPSRASTASGHTVESKDAKNEAAKGPKAITLARTTSVTPDAVLVPRSQRRGLFARFTLIPEVENPVHYARRTKWFITFIVSFCAMAAPMGSAIVMPVLQDIGKAFKSNPTVTNMTVAVYMLSMGIFPLWWSSFSERLGRRTICKSFVPRTNLR